MFKKLKKTIATIAFAMGNVEKNTLSQGGETLDANISQERRYSQGTLADDLLRGELTEEVKNLRWRTYKVLDKTQENEVNIIGVDENGDYITKTNKKSFKTALSKIKRDPSDDYPLEMFIENKELEINMTSKIVNTGETTTLIESEVKNKTERVIKIKRNNLTRFEIERYVDKMYIKSVDEENKLLELGVSKYPDNLNINHNFFISELKKIIDGGVKKDFLELDELSFISNGVVGSLDSLRYVYSDLMFDKITEFNGYYLIKFKCKVKVNGESLTEMFRVESLDKKYDNKEKR